MIHSTPTVLFITQLRCGTRRTGSTASFSLPLFRTPSSPPPPRLSNAQI